MTNSAILINSLFLQEAQDSSEALSNKQGWIVEIIKTWAGKLLL